MKISLILATLDRHAELSRFISYLSRQSWRNYELIVVDQSGDLQSAANQQLIADFCNDATVMYLRSGVRGLSRARNLGLAYASGSVVGFPDDDCWYPPDFLKHVVEKMVSHPEITILTGCYTEPGVVNLGFRRSPTDLKGLRGAQAGSSVTTFIRVCDFSPTDLHFDESLGAGTSLPIGEETDLIFRLLKRGYIGAYDPSVQVYHKIDRADQGLCKLLARERAYGYLLGKNLDSMLLARFLGGLLKLAARVAGRKVTLSQVRSRIAGFFLGLKARI